VPKADTNRLRGTVLFPLAELLAVVVAAGEDPAGEVAVAVVGLERLVGNETVGSPDEVVLAPETDPDPDPDPVGAGGRLSELETLTGPGPDPPPLLIVGDPPAEEGG